MHKMAAHRNVLSTFMKKRIVPNVDIALDITTDKSRIGQMNLNITEKPS